MEKTFGDKKKTSEITKVSELLNVFTWLYFLNKIDVLGCFPDVFFCHLQRISL